METKEEEAADVFVREHGEPLLDRAVYEEMRKINWKELREIRYKLFRQNLLDTIRRNLRV